MTTRRIPQLDGVRGIAILLVFVAHLLDGVFPHDNKLLPFVPHGGGGGFIGVQLFFALSGFLITSILVKELSAKNRIDLKGFYVRRARRLLPALFSVCLVYGIYALTLTGPERGAAFGSIARAATYTTNVPVVWRSVADSKFLKHTWSLAVEEQFYLLWPPVLALVWRRSRAAASWLGLVGAVLTVVMRLVPKLEPLSYEVLRWDALMLGALLAIVRPRIPVAVRWLGLPVLCFYAVTAVSALNTWDYAIGAIGSMLFIDLAMNTTFCENRVLVYFGRISYGLYLWHVFLMRFDVSPWIAGPASIALSEASFRFFESRFLAVHSKKAPQD